ncbi:MAG: hypothetical protein Q7U57_20660 [Methylovulum sp.]|nr:hypothetical protein [Methylovulum sp.]
MDVVFLAGIGHGRQGFLVVGLVGVAGQGQDAGNPYKSMQVALISDF